MKAKTEYIHDEYRLVIRTKKPRQAPVSKIYLHRRCGLAWPTAKSPGYWCVLGLLDEPLLDGRRPLELIDEAQEQERQRLYDLLLAACLRLGATFVLADLRDKWDTMIYSIQRTAVQRYVRGFNLVDASVFSGFLEARGPILELGRNNPPLLRMPPTSILRRQLGSIRPDDLHTVDKESAEERFPAVHALNHVVTSFDLYPWRKPPNPVEDHNDRQGGYG